jgi:hypothetical protein
MVKLGGLLFIVGIIFWLWALFDALTADAAKTRYLPKLLWLLIILVFMELGALAWVFLGRPRKVANTPGGGGFFSGTPQDGSGGQIFGGGVGAFGQRPRSTKPGAGPKRGPIGPDDDPDFLRGL